MLMLPGDLGLVAVSALFKLKNDHTTYSDRFRRRHDLYSALKVRIVTFLVMFLIFTPSFVIAVFCLTGSMQQEPALNTISTAMLSFVFAFIGIRYIVGVPVKSDMVVTKEQRRCRWRLALKMVAAFLLAFTIVVITIAFLAPYSRGLIITIVVSILLTWGIFIIVGIAEKSKLKQAMRGLDNKSESHGDNYKNVLKQDDYLLDFSEQVRQRINESYNASGANIPATNYDIFAMSAHNIATRFGNAIEQKIEKAGDSILSRQTARLVDKATLTLCLYAILRAEEKLDDSGEDSTKECRECLLKAFASRLMESVSTLRGQLDGARTSANAKQILLDGEITADIAQNYIEQIDDTVEIL